MPKIPTKKLGVASRNIKQTFVKLNIKTIQEKINKKNKKEKNYR